MPEWVTQVAGGGGLVGLAWAMVALYRARSARPISEASAAERMSQTAAEMVANANTTIERVRLDAENRIRATEAAASQRLGEALQDVNMARREAAEARQAAQQTERVVEMWYRRMTEEAYRPTATVERWRELVQSFPPNVGVNGAAVR